jgi:PIN domain nuclease of toxin-antitoxin system
MGRFRLILLDTCALLWWTLDPAGLSKRAKETCTKINSEGAFISSISIWEIGIKLKKGVLNLGIDINSYVNRLKLLGSIEIIAIDENIWIKNLSLSWENKDPADRTIVATALLRNLPIVTKDKIIWDFYEHIIW